MLAHNHGQVLNTSKLGQSLGVSHTTIRRYIDMLAKTFMIRILPPFVSNIKKRLVKSPKNQQLTKRTRRTTKNIITKQKYFTWH
ncbi:DUF4143 domain-containing protein [bacterium]|nr:DUF4143 domain-containing protein [bacterium]